MHKDKENKLKHLNIEKEKHLRSVYTFTPQVLNANKEDKFLRNKPDFFQRVKKYKINFFIIFLFNNKFIKIKINFNLIFKNLNFNF